MSKIGKLLIGNTKVSKDLKLLLIIGGLYSLSVALSNTFVNVYLWKQKSDYTTIALYNLFIVVAQPIIFILAGRWAKQIDRIIVLRLGVFSLSIFYLTVLLLGSFAAKYVILLGILLGIGYGFYWLAFNVLTFEITEPETRDIFNGFFGLLGSMAGMIGPFLAGWLITQMENSTGYQLIFGISLGLFVLAVVLSFFLKRRTAEGNFELGHVLRWNEISSQWKKILLGNLFLGIREGSFAFLISIWIFIAAGSEMALGTFSLVTSAVAFVVYFITGRFISQKHRKASMLIGSLVLSGAIWVIAFYLTFPKLMMYGIFVAIAYPLLMVPFASLTYDVIGKAQKAAEWRIEYVVARELFLNGGRIISILLFISLVTFFDEKKALPYFILFLGNTQLVVYYFARKVKLS
jgi:YQGE family putative transporter